MYAIETKKTEMVQGTPVWMDTDGHMFRSYWKMTLKERLRLFFCGYIRVSCHRVQTQMEVIVAGPR